MKSHELAEARASRTLDAMRANERAHRFGMRFEAAELRARSTPYFHEALAQLIQVAAEVQRAGGVPRISLRRCAAVAPRILLDVQINNRSLEFTSVVDLQGHAYAVCCEAGSARIPLIRRWDLGDFEMPGASLAHRAAIKEFLAEIQPSAEGVNIMAESMMMADQRNPKHCPGDQASNGKISE